MPHVLVQRPRPAEPRHRQGGDSKSLCAHIRGRMEVEGTRRKFLGARAVYSTQSFPSHFVFYNSHMVRRLGLLVPQTGQFKHQKFTICQFWSLEVQNQGVGRVGPSSGCDGESMLHVLTS